MHLASLIPDNVRTEIPIGAGPVAFVAHTFRHVEDNRDGQHVVLASESDKRLSRFGLNVCRVNHCESCTGQPPSGRDSEPTSGPRNARFIVTVGNCVLSSSGNAAE